MILETGNRIRAGELKEKLIFEKPTWTKTASGSSTATYTTAIIAHGSVEWDEGAENIESGQITAQRRGTIMIRYTRRIDETYRIKWGEKYLSIISITDVGNKHRKMILKVRQYVS